MKPSIVVERRYPNDATVFRVTTIGPRRLRDTYGVHPASDGVYRVDGQCQVFDGTVLVRATSPEEAVRKVAERVAEAIAAGKPAWQFDQNGLES